MHSRSRTTQRPEQSGNASQLYAHDAVRYTEANSETQRALGVRCWQCLALQGDGHVMADIGCGSGLSQVGAGAAWVGFDISPAMLALAQAKPSCCGLVCLSDMAQGLPLRPGSLHGATSVSALQWLFNHPQPGAALLRFFGSLHRTLRLDARAALQVYLSDNSQVESMLSAARAAGFAAHFCVDFPHPTPAAKYLLALHKTSQPSAVQLPICCLAWPRTGTCLMTWQRYLQQAGHVTAGLQPAVQRLLHQHAIAGKHVLRLQRRAESLLFEWQTDTLGAACEPYQPVLVLEAQAVQLQLQPCGGPVFLQLAVTTSCLAALQLSQAAAGIDNCLQESPDAQSSAAAGQQRAVDPGAQAAVMAVACALLGTTCLLQSKVTLEEGREAAAFGLRSRLCPYPSQQPEQCNGSGQGRTQQPYMSLQPVELPPLPANQPSAAEQRCSGGLQVQGSSGLRAAILHAQKSAQHLLLSCSLQSWSQAGTQLQQTLIAAGQANAAVVALDAVLRPDLSVEVTVLLFAHEFIEK